MNNFFDIIHLNGYMYAVDQIAKDSSIPIPDHAVSYDFEQQVLNKRTERGYSRLNLRLVIATTDPSLGLPLLPEVKEELTAGVVMKLAEKEFPYPKSHWLIDQRFDTESIRAGFVSGYFDGYKAATAKKYTEEDLRKAHFHGWFQRERYDSPDKTGYEGKYPKEWNEMDYEERENWFENQFIQSLNPKPIQVEVEMRRKCELDFDSCSFSKQEPDCGCEYDYIIEKGYIKVKRWIYE